MGAAPHLLIAGASDSGKTWLAKQLVSRYTKKGINVLVLTPKMDDKEWDTPYVYHDRDRFLEVAKMNMGCVLVIDEPESILGSCTKDADKKYMWFTTLARGWGHRTILVTQRPQQVHRTMRAQCGERYYFTLDHDDADLFAKKHGPILKEAKRLRQFEFFHVKNSFTEPVKMRLAG